MILPLLRFLSLLLLRSHQNSAWAFSRSSPISTSPPNTTIQRRDWLSSNPIIHSTRKATFSSTKRDDNDSSNAWINLPERAKGLTVLLTVPFAWGTYGPVVKYLYEIQPAVPGFVFSAAYYAVASLTTISIVSFQENKSNKSNIINGNDEATTATPKQSPFPVLGGIELGTYLFLGNCLQVIGLKTVPSDRAGFLVQLTTVMVPIAEALFAGNILAVSTRTWFSCLLAFTGICVMNFDGLSMTQGSLSSILATFSTFTQGDVLILAAAVLYTLHVVRLGRYAKETTPMKLAASKATWETFLSTGLVVALMSIGSSEATAATGFLSFVQETGAEIANFFSTITKSIAAGAVPESAILSAVGATLWTGLVTCAYTIFAQSYGQKRVGPTDANLIYSIQPLCTALFAFFLLGETMGPAGVVGGALIGAAVYIVTVLGNSKGDRDEENGDEQPVVDVSYEPLRNTTEVLVKK